MRRQIVLNQVKCLKCNKVITSRFRHDYQECGCDNHTMVDGGLAYSRRGGADMDLIQDQSVYLDDDYELVRKSFCRGSRGITGREPLKWVPLCEMSVDYINEVKQIIGESSSEDVDWVIELYNKELKYRLNELQEYTGNKDETL